MWKNKKYKDRRRENECVSGCACVRKRDTERKWTWLQSLTYQVLLDDKHHKHHVYTEAQLGGGAPAPSCISHFGSGHISNRGPTHFTLGLRPCIISSLPITNIPGPPFQNYPVVPCMYMVLAFTTLKL